MVLIPKIDEANGGFDELDLRSGDAEPLLKELGSWLPETLESWG